MSRAGRPPEGRIRTDREALNLLICAGSVVQINGRAAERSRTLGGNVSGQLGTVTEKGGYGVMVRLSGTRKAVRFCWHEVEWIGDAAMAAEGDEDDCRPED